jgi:hypothetical protein
MVVIFASLFLVAGLPLDSRGILGQWNGSDSVRLPLGLEQQLHLVAVRPQVYPAVRLVTAPPVFT